MKGPKWLQKLNDEELGSAEMEFPDRMAIKWLERGGHIVTGINGPYREETWGGVDAWFETIREVGGITFTDAMGL